MGALPWSYVLLFPLSPPLEERRMHAWKLHAVSPCTMKPRAVWVPCSRLGSGNGAREKNGGRGGGRRGRPRGSILGFIERRATTGTARPVFTLLPRPLGVLFHRVRGRLGGKRRGRPFDAGELGEIRQYRVHTHVKKGGCMTRGIHSSHARLSHNRVHVRDAGGMRAGSASSAERVDDDV